MNKKLVTMVASAAMTLSLVTTAFAAPATNSTCPAKNLLNQYIASNGAQLPTSGSALPANLQSILGQLSKSGTTPSTTCPNAQAAQQQLQQLLSKSGTTTCPNAQAAQQQLQQLLSQYGVKMPSSGTSASAPAATPAPTASTTPAPTATSTPTTGSSSVTPVSGSMSADESHMIDLVNQDRANNGLKPLTFDASLRAGALAHSQDMAQNNYFSHTSPTQGDFSTRVKAAGIQYSAAGENIAEYPGVDSAEVAFMNSAGHRANILGDYTRVGIGIVNKGGTYYITQWFAK